MSLRTILERSWGRLGMKCNLNLNDFMRESGIQLFNIPKMFTPNYVLAVRNERNITVSDMINTIETAIRFIKANFNVNQEKYAETLKFLKICRFRFENKPTKQPKKKAAHFVVDVFHEMQDMIASNDEEKRRNENFFMQLDLLIDMFIHE